MIPKKTQEGGRTMLETLSVVAIAGVLTLGGLMGYQMAMRQHAFNETINQLSIIIQNITAEQVSGCFADPPELLPMNQVISDVNITDDILTTPGGAQIALWATPDGCQLSVDFENAGDNGFDLCRKIVGSGKLDAFISIEDDKDWLEDVFGKIGDLTPEGVDYICKGLEPTSSKWF